MCVKTLIRHRTIGKDRDRDGLDKCGHADCREGIERDGTLLRNLPQVLEKVRLIFRL